MRIGLLVLSTGIMLGCSTFTATQAPEELSREPYRAMACDDLYLKFKNIHSDALALHSSSDTTGNTEKQPVSSEPVWKKMLNTSIENIQKLIDRGEKPNAKEIHNLTLEIAAIEEVAVEKECTPLLASLTEHRVQLRQLQQAQ